MVVPRVLLVSLLVVLVVVGSGSAAAGAVEEEREQSSRPRGDYCMNVDGDLLRSLGMTEAVMQRGGWVSHQPPPLFGSLQGASSGKVRRFHPGHNFGLFTFELTGSEPGTYFYLEMHRGKASEDMIATVKDAARFGWTVTVKSAGAEHTGSDGRKVRMESVLDLFVETV